ncbi:exodeoxyribonuclease VII small subunit [Propionimicrobium lymphophilum]|uniref:exodeoxyribonuclease VII small subunit n=1 Tax=Propionimicrobium lymphophilum TaxID=33012 RepID=UPI0004100292|nr:exodeoxyribonuclease VII small subunit [Propionimicrobium lymphophilum]
MSEEDGKQKPTYEQARTRLEEIVTRLESGGAPLAESMKLWEEGEKLAAYCQQFLDSAKEKIEASKQTES